MLYRHHATLLVLAALAGCATVPSGPSQLVLPGTGKSFDQFRFDDADCRQYATGQIGGSTPSQAAEDSGIKSAALGTALGAVAGAAIGGQQGAAVGAGTGLLVGGTAGASMGNQSAYSLQQRYDFGYQQCMYAKGHKVPVRGNFASQVAPQPSAPPAPPANYRPPYPPPPPPGGR